MLHLIFSESILSILVNDVLSVVDDCFLTLKIALDFLDALFFLDLQ